MQIVLTLTDAEYSQLLAYILDRDREGWYYGNKERFERRHQAILKKLAARDDERYNRKIRKILKSE